MKRLRSKEYIKITLSCLSSAVATRLQHTLPGYTDLPKRGVLPSNENVWPLWLLLWLWLHLRVAQDLYIWEKHIHSHTHTHIDALHFGI